MSRFSRIWHLFRRDKPTPCGDNDKTWSACKSFDELSKWPKGREKFIEFARDRGNSNTVNRLRFWFECPEVESLASFLEGFLMAGDNQLPDVDVLNVDGKSVNTYLEHASQTSDGVKKLKDSMRRHLNQEFEDFQKDLLKKIAKREGS